MKKFISKTKNPYMSCQKKENNSKVRFTAVSEAKNVQCFRNNTANITGRKITFKHV